MSLQRIVWARLKSLRQQPFNKLRMLFCLLRRKNDLFLEEASFMCLAKVFLANMKLMISMESFVDCKSGRLTNREYEAIPYWRSIMRVYLVTNQQVSIQIDIKILSLRRVLGYLNMILPLFYRTVQIIRVTQKEHSRNFVKFWFNSRLHIKALLPDVLDHGLRASISFYDITSGLLQAAGKNRETGMNESAEKNPFSSTIHFVILRFLLQWLDFWLALETLWSDFLPLSSLLAAAKVIAKFQRLRNDFCF